MKKFLKILSLSGILAGSAFSAGAYNLATNHQSQEVKVTTFDKNNLSTWGSLEKQDLGIAFILGAKQFYNAFTSFFHRSPTWNDFCDGGDDATILNDTFDQYNFSIVFPYEQEQYNVSYFYAKTPQQDKLLTNALLDGVTITVNGIYAPISGSITFHTKGDIT